MSQQILFSLKSTVSPEKYIMANVHALYNLPSILKEKQNNSRDFKPQTGASDNFKTQALHKLHKLNITPLILFICNWKQANGVNFITHMKVGSL